MKRLLTILFVFGSLISFGQGFTKLQFYQKIDALGNYNIANQRTYWDSLTVSVPFYGSFNTSDFNTTSGNVTLDYTNGQAASGSNKGFLTSSDWTTFNNKAPTASPTFTGTPIAPTAAALTSTTQLATTAFVTAGRPFTTPEDYGAVGDGVTNDATALQSCFTASRCALTGGKTYLSNTALTLPLGATVIGEGETSVIQFTTSSALTLISVTANNGIHNFKIKGPNAGASGASQIGIGAVGLSDGSVHKTGNKISNMTFENVGTGIYVIYTWTWPDNTTHGGAFDGDNLIFRGSYFRAITLDTRAEFNNFTNVQISGAATDGMFIRGGNNVINGGYIVNSGTAITLTGNAGDNSGKTRISNLLIGHNTNVLSVAATDTPNYISDSHLNTGGITIATGSKIQFSNCSFGLTTTWTNTSSTTTVTDCHFTALAATPFTVTGTSIDLVDPVWEIAIPTMSGVNIVSSTAGSISFTGSMTTGYVAKTGAYTLTGSDHTVEITSGTHTQTLPTAVGIAGRIYFVTNSGSGTVTLATTSSQTFVNKSGTPTSLTINQFGGVEVQSNGTNWLVKSIF